MKIKKGDKVIVLSGAEKGKTGTVLSTQPRIGKVLVEGINRKKRHKKSTSNQEKSGIIEDSHPIDVSKVAILRPGKKGLGSRIGFKVKDGSNKVRVYAQLQRKEIK